MIVATGFYPTISLYTHQKSDNCKKSCIDNILTNEINSVIYSGTISNKISQHFPIFQLLDIKSLKSKNTKHVQLYDYCNSNLELFGQEIDVEFRNNPPKDFTAFDGKFNELIDKTCKLEIPKVSKRNLINNPWITPGLIAASNTKHDLEKAWKKTCTKSNLTGDSKKHDIFLNHRRRLQSLIKKSKKLYYGKKFKEHALNKKKLWSILNELRGKCRKAIKPEFMIDNVKITNRRVIANEFNNYFISIATKLNSDCIGLLNIDRVPDFIEYLPKSCDSSIYLSDCTASEIREIIKELENGKSSDIPIRLIKFASPIICPHLERLFNACMRDGTFPESLKLGRIGPVYKLKGSKEEMGNYRPVSTLPIFGKIFEKLIYSRLYAFLSGQGLINTNQYGFRKGHSTSHALNYSISYIEKNLKEKSHVLGIFVDLSKAFDTIDHDILLYKLENYGIRGIANKLISSYLKGRQQYVHVLEEDSQKLPVVYGVPQGSVLGPLLFLLYINDISNTCDLSKFIMFADDTNIFVTGETKHIAYVKANAVLKLISKYMICNKLHINLSKCCYLYFSPFKRKPEVDI